MSGVVVNDDRHSEVLQHFEPAPNVCSSTSGVIIAWCSLGNHPAVDGDQVRQVCRHPVEVVRRQHDRDARPRAGLEQVEHVVPGADVDAGRWLVQYQRRCGSLNNARARNMRCCCPPDSWRMCRQQAIDPEPLEHLLDVESRSVRLAQGSCLRVVLAISTHSKTVTGKFQFTVSSCGT